MRGKTRIDLAQRNRGGQKDPALRCLSRQFRDGEKRLARKRTGRVDAPTASIRQQEGMCARTAAFGDALGIGQRKDGADAVIPVARSGARAGIHNPGA
jgi:hypothetical protein